MIRNLLFQMGKVEASVYIVLCRWEHTQTVLWKLDMLVREPQRLQASMIRITLDQVLSTHIVSCIALQTAYWTIWTWQQERQLVCKTSLTCHLKRKYRTNLSFSIGFGTKPLLLPPSVPGTPLLPDEDKPWAERVCNICDIAQIGIFIQQEMNEKLSDH